ncbi:MAG: nicotinamide-nucleotide amidohydrolase family protein [Paludibacteraceae bacterium]|nr:nicotinamide-nucleotide amidohydrolase family protein [Paludibacteraceae bacterium]
MTTHIINIGDELLIGQVVNTNASWMAEELNKRNIKVTNISVISDGADDIRTQLDRSLAEADVVLITGGLGPTKDDITKTVLCEYFGDTLVRHQPTYDQVARFFERRGLPFTEINQAQALVPSRCKVILNEVGTAPCMMFTIPNAKATFEQPMPKKSDTSAEMQSEVSSIVETQYIASLQDSASLSEKIVISMPGVPFEMKWLMQNHILPLLEERLGSQAIVHKTILTFGIGESFLADKIAHWEDALPAHIKLAYLPEAGKVRLRLSACASKITDNRLQITDKYLLKNLLEQEVAEQIVKLQKLICENIYGYDDETISMAIGKLLQQQGAMVATAESCTGGLIGNLITETPGSSAYYKGGIIAYSNELKERLLGVRHDTLEQYGAVSEETAVEMARGCLAATGADYAIATTGISGPTGATEDKPLGLVYVAVAKKIRNEVSSPNLGEELCEVVCNRYVFTTTRQQHQQRTANQALFDLYKLLSKNH